MVNYKRKKGILRALYWVRSRMYTIWTLTDEKGVGYNVEMYWDGNIFTFTTNTDELGYLAYKSKVDIIYSAWSKLLESELNRTRNKNLKLILSSHLNRIKISLV